jgi:hypothetical protein
MPARGPLTLALLFFALAATGLAATPSKHEVLDAIAVIERKVVGPEAAQAAKTIVVYAQLSDDVLVNIGTEQLPWLTEDWSMAPEKAQACESMLVAAFVAGNVRSQLRSERPGDDTYSGWLFALDAYRRLQAKYDFRSASLEALEKMRADGTLRRHADEVTEDEDRGDPQDAPRKPEASLRRRSVRS